MRTFAGEGAGYVPTDSVDAGTRLALINVWKTEKWSDTETVFICLDKADTETQTKTHTEPQTKAKIQVSTTKIIS